MATAPTTPDAPAAADDAAAPDPGSTRAGVVIAVLVVSAFVMILNETILSVALNDLTRDLGVSTTTVQWLTSGFLLTMAVVIPTTGFLLERFTPRQVFLSSLTLFSLGTLISALAPGFAVLLAGRVVQACGTALIIPLLMTSVMRLVPEHKRGSMMGTISIVIAVAPAIGPTIGGAVLASLSWRWMFWIVLPLAILALLLGAALMRLPSQTRSVPLDVLSVLLSALGFGGILYGFSAIGESGGSGPHVPPWIPLVIGAVSLVLFVVRQLALQKREAALLDLRPFTHRTFVVSLILAALLFMALLGAAAILLPLYLQTVLNQGTFVTGLAVLPGGLVLGLLGRPVGALFDRFGARPLVIPGALAMAASLWGFASLSAASPLWLVIVIHMVLMAGLGLMMTPLMTSSLAVLPGPLYSHGSAILATLQQVAGAFGTAAFVTISAIASTTTGGSPDAQGLRTGFMAAGVVGVIAFVVSFFLPRRIVASDDLETAADAPGDPRAGSVPAVEDEEAPADAPRDGSVRIDRVDGSHPVPRVVGQVELARAGEAVVTLVDEHGVQHGRAETVGGSYDLSLPGSGAWLVVVSAPGHAPRAGRVVAGEHDHEVRHDVTLVGSEPLADDARAPRSLTSQS
ncbi:hypothetical protein Acsp07_44980 [Actinomycetospora sp. NBRC 106378]|nr:hypothetical protein Acsp07_44980 [Actinomycetospora sp. NBRC 106378]